MAVKIEEKAFGTLWLDYTFSKGFRVWEVGVSNEKVAYEAKSQEEVQESLVHCLRYIISRRTAEIEGNFSLKDWRKEAKRIEKEVMESAMLPGDKIQENHKQSVEAEA